MAVINKNNKGNQTSDATESTTDVTKGKVVDILQDKSLPRGVKMKLAVADGKPLEDAWEFAAPPDEGKYDLRILLAKEACVKKYMDEVNPTEDDIYYLINFECKLIDEMYAGVTVFPSVATRLGRGKNISTAAGFLWKLGYKIPEEIDHYSLAKLVVQVVMKEPVLPAQLKWQGWSKEDKRVAYANQNAFPFDVETGKHEHVAQYKTKAGMFEEIKANLKVEHWYGKKDGEGDYKPKGGPTLVKANVVGGAGSGNGGTAAPVLVMTEEDEAPAAPAAAVVAGKGKAAAPAPEVNDAQDDLFAALEEA